MKDLTDKQIEKMFNDPKMLLWEHCNSVWFSGDEDFFYRDEVGGFDKKDRFWLLDKKNGDFWAGIGELGFCIEKGCGWRLNKSENKFEYYCDKNKKSS